VVGPVGGVGVENVGRTGPVSADRADGPAGQEAGGFGDSIGDALGQLGQAEAKADAAALAGATGDLSSVSDYMIAATEAQLVAEVTVAVRNRAIESFNDIMRMQV